MLVAIKDMHSHMITNTLDYLKNSKHLLSFQRFFKISSTGLVEEQRPEKIQRRSTSTTQKV